ncbi:MAG: hypothetical protein Q8W46_02820 [Candidatus Palauibacterales bacterium]|nr:hypothetical protein [Candidatus Palauibacterales bacterium]
MLGAVFFVIVVASLTGHYLLVERPRRIVAESAGTPRALPLRDLVGRLPAGVFLQPTFTWGQVQQSGDVELGVHPLLLSLVGPDPVLEMRRPGELVGKGDPLMTIGSGTNRLTVRSPLAGSVMSADRTPQAPGSWVSRSDLTCVIHPDDLSTEVPTWLIGKAAVDWSRAQYGRIRDHLLARSADPQTGLALADGGELPVGALNQLDRSGWTEFEEEFLSA